MIVFAGSRDLAQPIESKRVYYWYTGKANKQTYDLPLLLNYCKHSPTGFEWGYGGSGPAQLAWVIVYMTLMNETNVSKESAKANANLYHQGYKWQVIAGLPYTGWQLSGQGVLDWLQKQGYNPNLD